MPTTKVQRAIYKSEDRVILEKARRYPFGIAILISETNAELWYSDGEVFLVGRKDLKFDFKEYSDTRIDTKEYLLAADYDEPLILPSQKLKEWIGQQTLEDAYDSYEAAGFSEAEALGIFCWREKMLEIIAKEDRLPSVIEQAQVWEVTRKEGVLWARLNNYKIKPSIPPCRQCESHSWFLVPAAIVCPDEQNPAEFEIEDHRDNIELATWICKSCGAEADQSATHRLNSFLEGDQ